MILPELDKIEARAEKATPGPWEPSVVERVDPGYCHVRRGAGPAHFDYWERGSQGKYVSSEPEAKTDADFIAHARTDIPRLIAVVRKAILRGEHVPL